MHRQILYNCWREGWPIGHPWGMRAYSDELRVRVIDAVARGVLRAAVAEQFRVSACTIKRCLQRRRRLGTAPGVAAAGAVGPHSP